MTATTTTRAKGHAAVILIATTTLLKSSTIDAFAPCPSGGPVGSLRTVTSSPSSAFSSASRHPLHHASSAYSSSTALQMVLFPAKGGIIVEPPSDGFVARDVLLDDFMGRSPTSYSNNNNNSGRQKPSEATFICTPSEDDASFKSNRSKVPNPSRANRVDPKENYQANRRPAGGGGVGVSSPVEKNASDVASMTAPASSSSLRADRPFKKPRAPSVPPPDFYPESFQYVDGTFAENYYSNNGEYYDDVNQSQSGSSLSNEQPKQQFPVESESQPQPQPQQRPEKFTQPPPSPIPSIPGFPNPSDMKLREIQSELQNRGVDYSDCFDRESLALRLAEARTGNVPVAAGVGAAAVASTSTFMENNNGNGNGSHEHSQQSQYQPQKQQQQQQHQQQQQPDNWGYDSQPQHAWAQGTGSFQQQQRQQKQGREIGFNSNGGGGGSGNGFNNNSNSANNGSRGNGPRRWWS